MSDPVHCPGCENEDRGGWQKTGVAVSHICVDPEHDRWLEDIKNGKYLDPEAYEDLDFQHPQLKQEADFWISPPERGDSIEPPSPFS